MVYGCVLFTWYAGESSVSVCGMWNTASSGERRILSRETVRYCIMCWQNLRVVKYVGDEKKLAWGKHWIELGFNSELLWLELCGTLKITSLSLRSRETVGHDCWKVQCWR